MAKILDGAALAKMIRQEVALEVQQLKNRKIIPHLTFILVGENPASLLYVRSKEKACQETGIESQLIRFPENISPKKLIDTLQQCNADKKTHGVLVQLPLPRHINTQQVLSEMDPAKDVDGFHPENVGKLVLGLPAFRPCTPTGIMALLDSVHENLKGKNAVVVGRSNIVGKPVALMLLEKGCTVQICHSATKNLDTKIKEAEVLVVAIGKPHTIPGEWIREGAIVIDVGINRMSDGTIVGDVDFEEACQRAAAITPVPGGVGPMTIAMLLKNTLTATKEQTKL